MSSAAATLPYWGKFPRQWGTSITTTDVARRNNEAEERPEHPQEIVFIVTPPETAFSTLARELRFHAPGLSKLLPRMFILEAPSGAWEIRSTAQSAVAPPEVDPSAWRGSFAIHPARTILFSQTMELRTGMLRRLTPRIHIDRRTSERRDA